MKTILYLQFIKKHISERQKTQCLNRSRRYQTMKSKKFGAAHRIGNLKIGEVSVAEAIYSEHRAEASEAARYAIDQINEVPIWKQEIVNNGKEAIWTQGIPMSGG